ncbi:hypothetical protein C1H46_043769 [Malus baccata]|uniref:Uncharacterized protein n=1 Tax=Malus baccata TaxID=106549 RepID=A0A540K8Y9_MALBA|nr:hypothetical protein C1H46_043769 [Malus baccata]
MLGLFEMVGEFENVGDLKLGKGRLAIEYPVNGLGGECSVPSHCVTQVVEEVLDERGNRVVGDEVVGKRVPHEMVVDEGVVDEGVEDEGMADE